MKLDVRTAPIHIAARPAEVYAVLADTSTWSSWAAGFGLRALRVSLGAPCLVQLPLLPGPRPPLPARFTLADPYRGLAWGGGVPGLLRAVHAFELSADGDGTELVHYETFTGPGSLPLAPLQSTVLALYERMNAGLRRHVEARVSA